MLLAKPLVAIDLMHIFARREGSSSWENATRSLITWIRRGRASSLVNVSAPGLKKASAICSCSALENMGFGGSPLVLTRFRRSGTWALTKHLVDLFIYLVD
jgi:hypothetical protein